MERLVKNDPHKTHSERILKNFAEEGLRTLCVAEVDLDEDKYKVRMN